MVNRVCSQLKGKFRVRHSPKWKSLNPHFLNRGINFAWLAETPLRYRRTLASRSSRIMESDALFV
jgi:hypothetical protein